MITAKRFRFDTVSQALDFSVFLDVCSVKDRDGNDCWQITSHDHDDVEFYQIGFMSNNAPDDVLLRIESPMLSGNDGQSDMLIMERADDSNIVWHQKSIPDYVTCAGIFRVIEQDRLSGNVIDRTPWIYCLPSSISIVDYQVMLYDLIEMHDGLARRHRSKVAAGSVDLEAWADSLIEAVRRIQRPDVCVTRLKKEYVRTRIENIHRFDSKVIQSYIQNGMSGMADGVRYIDTHDVYENRVIKRAIQIIAEKMKRLYDKPPIEFASAQQQEHNSKQTAENRILEKQRQQSEKIEREQQEKLQLQRAHNHKSANLVSKRLETLLSEKWFLDISDIEGNVFPLQYTPVFMRNRDYANVFILLSDFSQSHAAVSCNIDINGFGVKKTCDIYELWVLYLLLYKLDQLDFKLDEDGITSILDDFRRHLTGEHMPKSYTVDAVKLLENGASIHLEFGYNCAIRDSQTGHYYTPDYYIKIKHNKDNHWYFIDAKYKGYYYNNPNMRTVKGVYKLVDELKNVSYDKYIVGVMDRVEGHIMGSYLIVASIDARRASKDDISNRHFIFGGEKGFDSDHEYPNHKYGAVQVTPSSLFELDILIKLIFEYKESVEKGAVNLNYCWSCGKKMLVIPPDDPEMGHNPKVTYRKCECAEFRVESYCRNCLSLIVKHSNGNYHYSHEKDRWNIVCPRCGDHFEPRQKINQVIDMLH